MPLWQEINSKLILKKARELYIDSLINSSLPLKPKGIVINVKTLNGLIVSNIPALLPNEQFIDIGLLYKSKKIKFI